MEKYQITAYASDVGDRYCIGNAENTTFFGGYDFMGSAIWGDECCWMSDLNEAKQILRDLVAAD